MLGLHIVILIFIAHIVEWLPSIVAVFIDAAVVMEAHACFQFVGKKTAARFGIN